MARLAQQLGPGSVAMLEAAVAWRLEDARVLDRQGRRCAAIYLYGYVAEIRLCAATYRVCGYDVHEPVMDAERQAHEKAIQQIYPNPRGNASHHLPGWARYLTDLRRQKSRGLPRLTRDALWAKVDNLYEQWRPRLRYKAIVPTTPQLRIVRQGAEWLDDNYDALWR